MEPSRRSAPVQHSTRTSILLTPAPVYLSTDDRDDRRHDSDASSEVTIDTEAALLVSRQSLSRVVGSTDPDVLDELRQRIRVTAVPSTHVLVVEVRATSTARVPGAGRGAWPTPIC